MPKYTFILFLLQMRDIGIFRQELRMLQNHKQYPRRIQTDTNSKQKNHLVRNVHSAKNKKHCLNLIAQQLRVLPTLPKDQVQFLIEL